MTTLAEMWTAEAEAKGRTEGRAEGRAEGEAKGRAQGKGDVLRRLLTLKFGELTQDGERRIASANESELDRWIERVLTADSFDAVVGL